MNSGKRLSRVYLKGLFFILFFVLELTAGVAVGFAGTFTIFHVNDTHARVTPHKMIIPGHGADSSGFEDVGGAAFLATQMLGLVESKPDALVIDAGDISEGNPIGDMNGNGAMTQFYALLSSKLQALRGRGMDAVVVGNHDVRDVAYINNLAALRDAGVPVISVNVRNINDHTPYFAPYTIVTINGTKIGILGYTTQASEVGASLASTIEIAACDWNSTDTSKVHLADYVNELRNKQGCALVILAAHVGHSTLVDPGAPLLADDGSAKLPEVAVTGHWHTWAETVWQPEMLGYKTIFTESGSYMKYIGELNITDTGDFVSSIQHVVRNAELYPDPDVQTLINGLIEQYNNAHPGHPFDELIGYTADDLMLDNRMRWWSEEEYPWSGNNTAGQWICDAMRWKAEQIFGQCDIAFETGGGVRADIPAGPVTYTQIYETFPWADDTFMRINMTGLEIMNFLKQTVMDAGFSSALDVTAFDGIPTSVTFNGQPIDLNHTYTVAINNYMYAHPPTGWTWSDASPLTSNILCREGIVDFMRQFSSENPYHVGGPRYHLNTEFAGGFHAVVTMIDDSDTKPSYEDAFIRLLSATPETLARRGSNQVPADLVNADGTINADNRLSEQELYRSYLGFKTGALKPGDIIEVWGKGSFYGGNPEFVDQEGIWSDGVEFRIVGHDDSLAKPAYMHSISAFWNNDYKNHYVEFLAKRTGSNTVVDQNGLTISVMDVTGYAAEQLPGAVGDILLITGVPTMESYGLRFRCNKAVVAQSSLPPQCSGPSSQVDPIPAGTTSPTLSLTASAMVGCPSYSLLPVADSQVSSGYPNSNYGTSTSLYLQSSSTDRYHNERAWLRFDLSGIPEGSTITGATLQLYNWKSAGAALQTEVCGSSSDTWSESTITFNNQPSFESSLATQTFAAGVKNLWYNWDVTSFVKSEFAGNKLVSLVVKAVTEDASDTVAPSYAFDSKEYSSTKPVLQVITSGGSVTVAQVQFYYRYSADNANWGPWTSYDTATSPFSTSFNFPQGQGYYEFYSRATDSLGNLEQAPVAAQAFTRYTAYPEFYPLISLAGLYQYYDGQPKNVAVTTIPDGLAYSVTYNGSSTLPVARGLYSVVVNITDPDYPDTSATDILTIEEAPASISFGGMSYNYDGSPKAATVSTNPPGLAVSVTYNGLPALPVTAGTYNVVAKISDPNFFALDAAGTLTIDKGTASITFGPMGFVYDGSVKTAAVFTNPAGLPVSVTYDGSSTAPVYAGTYAVAATINDANYQGGASGTLTITRATATVTLGNLDFTYDGSAKIVSVSTIPSGLNVAVTYNGSSNPPSAEGTYSIAATVNDRNYEGTASGTMRISDAGPVSTPAIGPWCFVVLTLIMGGFLVFRRRS